MATLHSSSVFLFFSLFFLFSLCHFSLFPSTLATLRSEQLYAQTKQGETLIRMYILFIVHPFVFFSLFFPITFLLNDVDEDDEIMISHTQVTTTWFLLSFYFPLSFLLFCSVLLCTDLPCALISFVSPLSLHLNLSSAFSLISKINNIILILLKGCQPS